MACLTPGVRSLQDNSPIALAPSPSCFMASCKNEPIKSIDNDEKQHSSSSVAPFEKARKQHVEKENMTDEMKKKMAYYKLVYKKKN